METRDRGFVTLVKHHPTTTYFILAIALSWAWWLPLAVGERIVDAGTDPSHGPGLLGPMLAALVVTGMIEGWAGVKNLISRMGHWKVKARWYAVALSPALFFLLGAFAMAAAGEGWPAWSDLGRFGGFPTGILWVSLSLFLINGFGEETGWRGFALPSLQHRHSLLTSSLVIAAVWMVWHTPNFFFLETYKNFSPAVIPGFFLGIAAGAVFLSWLYNASGGSILIVTLWHAVYNLFSGSYAARGTLAAIVSTFVMAWGIVIVIAELRGSHSHRQGRAVPPKARQRSDTPRVSAAQLDDGGKT